jgi:hypothetical protein
MDWVAWHADYADPTSRIARRLPVVQAHIRSFLDRREAAPAIRVVSFCSGSGSDLLPVLSEHPAGERVRARLVELDPELAEQARTTASAFGLAGVDVVTGDASTTDAFAGAVPADLVLVCGVFGNIPDADVERTVRALPGFCAEGATVVWTRHRAEPDLTPAIRAWFAEAGFAELAFDSPGIGSYAVGSNELTARPQPLERGAHLFTFTRER